jgi:hypothetical protein
MTFLFLHRVNDYSLNALLLLFGSLSGYAQEVYWYE